MKTAYQTATRVEIRDVQLPSVDQHEIRVRIDACGVCGTDLHVPPEDADTFKPFGHEIACEILEMGAAVRDLQVGQKVVLESSSACGRCENCRDTRQELCTNVQHYWTGGPLGFGEEMISPAICAVPYAGISPEVASLSEPLGVAIDLVRLADITTRSNVLLLGAGPIGLMALSLVRRRGARKIFVGEFRRQKARWDTALTFGADAVFDPTETPITEYDFGCPIDRILVTAPPKTVPACMKIAAKGAIISYIGIEWGSSAGCTFDANDFHFKKLQLRASYASPALYTPQALRYLEEGVIDGEALISHRVSLSELPRGLEIARNDPAALKVIVLPNQ
ncbi:MAG: alcohol dehydrogenase catalytic domain-containing protein [Phycisphaerae bacterium]|nr:alcohol dehydrogenase catalytic domain-containing protein [Phycisphaerae bacterium]